MIDPKIKDLGTLDSRDLAEYILFKIGRSCSHLKLQKLLYYVQAYHLAYFEQPIIEDEFEAWVHGPVSRKLFNELKDVSRLYAEIAYVQSPGEPAPTEKLYHLTSEQVDLIDEIIAEYGPLTGFQLENLSHSERPWLDARKGLGPADKCSRVIAKSVMGNYYREQLYVQED